MTTQITEKTDQRMDLIMSHLLRTGVLLSAMFVLAGGALYLLRHPTPVTDYHNFQGEPAEFRTVAGIFHEVLALRGRGLIQFGLLLLIATPIARVVFAVFAFLWQRDWTYVVVTLMVLTILFYSLLGQHP